MDIRPGHRVLSGQCCEWPHGCDIVWTATTHRTLPLGEFARLPNKQEQRALGAPRKPRVCLWGVPTLLEETIVSQSEDTAHRIFRTGALRGLSLERTRETCFRGQGGGGRGWSFRNAAWVDVVVSTSWCSYPTGPRRDHWLGPVSRPGGGWSRLRSDSPDPPCFQAPWDSMAGGGPGGGGG